MVKTRQAKVDGITREIAPCHVIGDTQGDVLVVSWGSPYGSCLTAVRQVRDMGKSVSHLNLRWLNPLPADLGDVLAKFGTILVPEINNGQLIQLLRAKYPITARGYNRISGQPLTVGEIQEAILGCLPD
jgi:2-oxoglutarate ferredoxin oxidoreductase subunit alpha